MSLEERTMLEYQAAQSRAGVAIRPERRFLEVLGRAPGDMLTGILTCGMPGILVEEAGVLKGEARYSALLTAKGRMITDLHVYRGLEEGFLLDLPDVGLEDSKEWFRKFLPPRLAKFEDRSPQVTRLTLLGPEGPASLERVILGAWGVVVGPVEEAGMREEMTALGNPVAVADIVTGLGDCGEVVFPSTPFGVLRVARNGDLAAPAWDLILASEQAVRLRGSLVEDGAAAVGKETLEILRIEKGRPAFGTDMDRETIPVEAGIHRRAIDHGKGCYTGQEVIIRIRDRGQVNKELHGLLLGESPIPPGGRELYSPEKERAVGWITSACFSPAFGQTAALGYLRRGFGPGGEVRVGDPQGPPALIRALETAGWVLD